MTKEEAQQEIDLMVKFYHDCGYNYSAFFVAPENSLWDKKQGDSARYWELKNIIEPSPSLEI